MNLRKPRALDYRSRLAIEGVLAGKSRPQALRDAGYSPSYSTRRTGLFFSRFEVAAALEKGWKEIRKKSMYTVERAMAEADDVIQLAKISKNPMAYCKAVELRAKLSGLLQDVLRVEHVNVQGALKDARKRTTLPWNQYRQIEAPVFQDPFEGLTE